MCVDEVFLEVELANLRDEALTLDGIGLAYMLQGGIGVDDRGVQTLGPHTIIALPADEAIVEAFERRAPEGLLTVFPVEGTFWIIMPIAPRRTNYPGSPMMRARSSVTHLTHASGVLRSALEGVSDGIGSPAKVSLALTKLQLLLPYEGQ